MVLNATFSSIFQLYRGSLFYWWSKPEYPKFSYITVLYNTNFVEFNFFWILQIQIVLQCSVLVKHHDIFLVLITRHTILQVKAWFQKLAPSSKLKRTPPTGAPKAADTPAAAPPDTKSLFSVSDLNISNIWKSHNVG